MGKEALEKELARFLKEQTSHLAPIPVALLQKYIIELEENTSTPESVELLIVVTKKDAYQLTKGSSNKDSEIDLLLKNLLKAKGLDHKKICIYALDVPDASPISTANKPDALVEKDSQEKLIKRFLGDIKHIQPSYIILFNGRIAPLFDGSNKSILPLAKMGELFELEHSQCLVTHCLNDLLSNKSLKRETWDHVQKIPSNF